jgi:hypothetical protein
MLLLNAPRSDVLSYFPRGFVAAEVGVAEGGHARQLLDRLAPKKLHLIDPWRFQDIPDYVTDANNTTDEEGDRRYNGVLAMFDRAIRDGTVEVHRALSTEIANKFPDEYFDFVYIDANHTYSACLEDLCALDPKVKRTGFILGHDYQTIPIARAHHNGVIQAAHNFIIERGYNFLALTFEEAPSYIIAKDPDCAAARTFLANCVVHCQIMAQIVNAEYKVFEQVEIPGSMQRYVFSFD